MSDRTSGSRAAVLLDGGFVSKRFGALAHRFPEAADVVAFATGLLEHPRLSGSDLFRVFYYDAPPLTGMKLNPIDATRYNFSSHPAHGRNQSLQESLAVATDFAVRRGETVFHGWKLRSGVLRELAQVPRVLAASDVVPDVAQKGVDLRIGLDVATLSVKRIVDTIVLVSGDSDLVPAMKFARREGVRVVLETMGQGIRVTMREHSDLVLDSSARIRVEERHSG